DHALEALEVDPDDMVDPHAADLLDHLRQTPGAADGERGVELHGLGRADGLAVGTRGGIPALAFGSGDLQVTGEGDHHDALPVLRDVGEHHRVRPGTLDRLRGADVVLGLRALPGVGADDEEVRVTDLRGRVPDVGRVLV